MRAQRTKNDVRPGGDLVAQIKTIIVELFDIPIPPWQIDSEKPLMGGQVQLTSIAILDLVLALEDIFGIEIADEDLRIEMFMNVKSISEYLKRKGVCSQ